MKGQKPVDATKVFAVEIVKPNDALPERKRATAILGQLWSSGTSKGANVHSEN